MNHEVYFLQLILKNDHEDADRIKGRILKHMKCWCKPGFHAKRSIIFVAVTPETLDQFFDRIEPFLTELKELGSIERFMLQPAPVAVITDHNRQVDPLSHYLRLGRVEAAERNKSQRLQNRERRKCWI